MITRREVEEATGVSGIRTISEHTIVIEYANGSCRPATALEIVLWSLLTRPRAAE